MSYPAAPASLLKQLPQPQALSSRAMKCWRFLLWHPLPQHQSTKLTLLAGCQAAGNTCGLSRLTALGNMVLSTEAPQDASGSVHEWPSLGLLWGELQVLGHGDRV